MTPTQAVRPELASMFAPRSIALVGVSERSLWSTLILDGLGLMGFDGRLELVNPLRPEVRGRPTRASLAEMAAERGPVDVAFVLTAASQVGAVLDDAAKAGIADIIVLASGFSETGLEGAAAERGLAERARDAGLRRARAQRARLRQPGGPGRALPAAAPAPAAAPRAGGDRVPERRRRR